MQRKMQLFQRFPKRHQLKTIHNRFRKRVRKHHLFQRRSNRRTKNRLRQSFRKIVNRHDSLTFRLNSRIIKHRTAFSGDLALHIQRRSDPILSCTIRLIHPPKYELSGIIHHTLRNDRFSFVVKYGSISDNANAKCDRFAVFRIGNADKVIITEISARKISNKLFA